MATRKNAKKAQLRDLAAQSGAKGGIIAVLSPAAVMQDFHFSANMTGPSGNNRNETVKA